MKKTMLIAAMVMVLPTAAIAAESATKPYRFADNWPTHYTFDDGTDAGLALKYQYDLDCFSNDGGGSPTRRPTGARSWVSM